MGEIEEPPEGMVRNPAYGWGGEGTGTKWIPADDAVHICALDDPRRALCGQNRPRNANAFTGPPPDAVSGCWTCLALRKAIEEYAATKQPNVDDLLEAVDDAMRGEATRVMTRERAFVGVEGFQSVMGAMVFDDATLDRVEAALRAVVEKARGGGEALTCVYCGSDRPIDQDVPCPNCKRSHRA